MTRQSVACLIVMSVCSPMYAQVQYGNLTRGLFGNIEYGYMRDSSELSTTSTEQSTINQRYTIGKRGSIYSPNLLSYLLQGSFLIQDIDATTNSESVNRSQKVDNYRVNADFFRKTNFPFTLYGDKSINPYASIDGGNAYSYDASNEQMGVTGSMKLPYFDLQYTAENFDTKRNETFADETRKGSNYSLTLSKNYEQLKLSLSYIDRNQDYNRVDRNQTVLQNWTDHNRNMRANAIWTPQKEISVISNIGYSENSYIDMKNTSGNVNASWTPNNRLQAGADVSVNFMQAGGMRNDTVMISENSSYRFSPETTARQTVSLYRTNTDNSDMTVGMATAGGQYSKTLDNNVSVNGGVDVGIRNEQYSSSMNTGGIAPSRTVSNHTISAGASKRIEAIRATISANASYYGTYTSLQEKSKRFNLNTNFNARVNENTHFVLYTYYLQDESSYLSGSTLDPMKTQQLSVNAMFRYSNTMGYNGNYSVGAGLMYTNTKMGQNDNYNRLLPSVDASLMYRLLDSMMLNSNVVVSQDTVSDVTNYSAYLGLNYHLRKIAMSMGIRHFRQEGGTVGMLDSKRESFFFKVTRPF